MFFKKLLLIFIAVHSLQCFSLELQDYYSVQENDKWVFSKSFKLPGKEIQVQEDLIEMKFHQSKNHNEGGQSILVSGYPINPKKKLWFYSRDNKIFIHGHGHKLAFYFDGFGEYQGSFNGGLKLNGKIKRESIQLEPSSAPIVRFTLSENNGQTYSIVFAEKIGILKMTQTLKNGAQIIHTRKE